jgi:hypothetical protein
MVKMFAVTETAGDATFQIKIKQKVGPNEVILWIYLIS